MYMVTHKHVDYIPKGRTPVFVGNGDNPDKFLRDNTGINISEKNPYYCELTALYWIWKNDHHSKYVSIEHYRRFFMKRNTNFAHPYKKSDMLNQLNSGNSLFIRPGKLDVSVKIDYCENHIESDYLAMQDAIREIHPDYQESFNKIMGSHGCSLFNMCAMDKSEFDLYCEWLFTLLFEIESKVSLNNRTSYQQRAFGFMAERLLNVWVSRNISKIHYCDVYYYEHNKVYSALKSLKHEIRY